MDELHYNYDITKNNQLLHINDSLDIKDTQYKNFYSTDIDDHGIFAATSPNYQYDASGNVIASYERRKESNAYRFYLKELTLYGLSSLGIIDAGQE